MRSKKGLEMGFSWIFGLLVGAAILGLAIYGVIRLVETSQKEIDIKTAQNFLNVLDPLQTTIQEGSGDSISLPVQTKIYTSCDLAGDFGNTLLEISQQTGLGGKWSKKSNAIRKNNAYLFSENEIEGKKIFVFIFSLNMPFKVGDMIISYTDNYCFVSAPDEISKELRGLITGENQNIILTSSKTSCPKESKTVCFSGGSCNISVTCFDAECSQGSVIKNGTTNYFSDKLMYSAIFSSKENYECNVKRLMKRLNYLSDIYFQKSQFVASRGCNTGLTPDMQILSDSAKNYRQLGDLGNIKILSENIKDKNLALSCHLF